MRPTPGESPPLCPAEGLVPSEWILFTKELKSRPSRPPDYETENRALAKLVQALADSPETILQVLADTILEDFQAGSAGLSLLTKDGDRFFWPAIAGEWKPHIGGGTPRDFGPCGDVLNWNGPLLFKRWDLRYPYLQTATPLAEEGLLVPFYVGGKAVGTIWAIAHDDGRTFDGEDLRLLESLGRFASAAYQAVELQNAREAELAALRLMDDAVQSRHLVETLNVKLRQEMIERKQAQAVNDRSTQKFEAMTEGAPLGIYVVDADFRVCHVNPIALPAFGSIPDLMGKDFGEVMRLLWSKECADENIRQFRHTLETGESYFAPDLVSERLDRGGTEYYEWRLKRLPLADGRDGVVCYFWDISQRVLAERKTRESEERFRSLFNLSSVAVYSIDTSGVIQNFNLHAAELWGQSPAAGDTDQLFCGSYKLYRPDGTFMPHDRCPMATVASGEIAEVRDGEVLIERPDGTWITVLVNIRPSKNDRGEITGAINCFYDISERKRHEDALRESEERYRTLFDSIDEGFCVIEVIFDKDLKPVDYRFLEVNPAFEKQSGIQQATGKRMREIALTEVEAHWFETYGKVALTGEPVRFTNEFKALNRWFDIYACPVGGPQSRKVAVVFNDITERKREEMSLSKLAAIIESSDDAILSTDLNGVIISWNRGAENLFGYTALKAVGQSVAMLIPPERANEEPTLLERICRGESVNPYETVRVRKDGTSLDISLTVSPIKNRQGNVIGASRIARDITSRKRNEEALRQSREQISKHAAGLETVVGERTAELTATNQQLEAFVYSMAHDLRAPLRSMQGFSAMLVEEAGASLSVRGRDFAGRIDQSAQFMDALLIDLLAFSRIAQQQIELASVNLETVVQSVLSRLDKELQEKKGRVECAGPWPAVLAHEPTLGQVIFNLVSNALKFVRPDAPPCIRLHAEEQGRFIRVWVEDNGIGIALEHQPKIFGLFTRLRGSEFPGTGIGLAIVEKSLERMGGNVGVESTPGEGSRFWFNVRKAAQT
jgi:PAS domain S-box-containing protein